MSATADILRRASRNTDRPDAPCQRRRAAAARDRLGRLRSRMQDLLLRYYGPSAVTLREASRPSHAAYALAAYFDGDLDAIADLVTETNGTPFQHTVWAALRRIPAGRTTSYGALAAAIGRPKAIRAVGSANGANPDRHRCAVPSGDRRERVVDRLWRRAPSQALAACA